MRRIETKEESEKRERRNKIIIGVILAVIMLLSTAGYAFFSEGKNSEESLKVNVNGKDFYKQGNLWATAIDENVFYFNYLPNDTQEISLKKRIGDYSNKPLYFAKFGLAEEEIARNLEYAIGNPRFACMFDDSNCTENWPVKNCSSNIIIIKEQNIGINPFREEENCVFIFSNETIKAADAFVYRILGIK